MRPAHLRLFALAVVALLLLLFVGLPWQPTASAQLPTSDFAPALSEELATAQVTAAQQEEARRIGFAGTGAAAYRAAVVDLPSVRFSQSGRVLTNRYGFLDYWRSNGQLHMFGYPVSEELEANGRVIQYFERARFEFDPTFGKIQLGLIGKEALGNRTFERAEPLKNARYFAETGHNLHGKFRKFWEKRGGLELFGYPLSEEFEENGRVVQYFERARFEYHPEEMSKFFRQQERKNGFLLATLNEVQITPLGKQLVEARGIASPTIAASAPEWTPKLWPRRIEVDLSTQQLRAYEGALMVYQAPVATGRNGFNTPVGEYAVYRKTELHTMRGSMKGETWKVPNVPWIMYINGGVAIHGTYWHNKFGTGYRPSHGCINVSIDDAQWLYEWASVGTPVIVHK